jgi:ABC-type nitrate/sulfonate/bicarbonate transport system permease component
LSAEASPVSAAIWLERLGPSVAGILGILLLWTIAAEVFAALHVIPTPLAVAEQLWADRHIYPINAGTTLREALFGYLWGNLAAIVLGALFVEFPIVERVLLKLAIASYCIPLVAIAPILVVVLSGDGPKVALAALSVFFTTLVATVLGLRTMDAVSVDVVRSTGGGAWRVFRMVRVPGALPSVFAGLRVAAPAALLGAVIGEYLGASQGLGVALIQAQSSFEVARAWGVALVMAGLGGLLYAIASLAARVLTPWVGREAIIGLGTVGTAMRAGGRLRRALSAFLFFIASIAVAILIWYGLIRLFRLDSFFAKTPLDVWRYLVTDAMAADHRAEILDALGVTLIDAGTGYLAGTAVAVIVAAVMAIVPAVEQAIMPSAIVLRSIPIVAMAPLIALVFGRGLVGVTVVVGLVTFFPTLVYLVSGLRSAPERACEIVVSLGGSRFAVARKVRLVYALPALFAAARIAVPAAIGGATLAEWLSTGQGVGNLLVLSYSASKFTTLWSASVVVVGLSVGFYAAIGLVEGALLRRYGTELRP